MMPQPLVSAAHSAAVMVRAQGPDPKGRKMPRRAFFQPESAVTTLSASGFLALRSAALDVSMDKTQLQSTHLPDSSVVVVTCGSIVEPFLSQSQSAYEGLPTDSRDFPKLIPGAEIDVLVEVLESTPSDGEHLAQRWIPAYLECLVDIPAAAAALQMLLDMHGGTEDGAWEVGWALGPVEGHSQVQGLGAAEFCARGIMDKPTITWATVEPQPVFSTMTNGVRVGNLSRTVTKVAVLSLSGKRGEATSISLQRVHRQIHEVDKKSQIPSDVLVSSSLKRGDSLLAVGSPFGALSPLHFHNSVSAGIVSNCWPPRTNPIALVMADLRCLPGMEGGPVFDSHGELAGMLTRPLRLRGGVAEVQLVMTAAVLTPALHLSGVALGVPIMPRSFSFTAAGVNQMSLDGAGDTLDADSCQGMLPNLSLDGRLKQEVSPAITQALKSVVLVTIGSAAWASGVIISSSGLILTNAHLLEPWRFGKMGSSHLYPAQSKCDLELTRVDEHDEYWVISTVLPLECSAIQSGDSVSSLGVRPRSYQRIRVRLDHLQEHSWHNAKVVYVSRGPLDIALLQLIAPPLNLCPIVPEESCPLPGSPTLIIGHGLFGPRAELCASVSAGVVAKVVTAKIPAGSRGLGAQYGDSSSVHPVMLQTTASVHQGGSGGAVVDNQGRMIGLVTSNARHGGGRVIPYLNFSVPFGLLAPIFKFASEAEADLAILSELEKPNKELSTVWALVPSTPRPPGSSIPNPRPRQMSDCASIPQGSSQEDQKDVPKGYRFSKFMTDRSTELGFKWPLPGIGQPISQAFVDTNDFSPSCSPHLFSSL